MKFKRNLYPVLVAVLFGLCSLIHGVTETSRLALENQPLFFYGKMFFGFVGIGLGYKFYRDGLSDFWAALFMANFGAYCVYYVWLAPLYEIAFLQGAIATSFFSMRRQWIYPLIWGFTMICIMVSYPLQDRWGVVLPPVDRLDWYWASTIFFLMGWFIHKFAIGTYRKDQDRLLRFGVIGKETTRLTHDLKGLLSSPLIMVDALRDQSQKISPDVLEKQLLLLANDMENVREVLRSIHRLVNVDELRVSVDILASLQSAMKVLERRLQGVRIQLPERKTVYGNADRMHSIFFNLFLNSVEAFETKAHKSPEIVVRWEEATLVFSDNAGVEDSDKATRSSKDHGSGLGLELIRSDLQEIEANFDISFNQTSTVIKIHFPTAK